MACQRVPILPTRRPPVEMNPRRPVFAPCSAVLRAAAAACAAFAVLAAFGMPTGLARESNRALDAPTVRMRLEGPIAARLDAIVENWLIPAPRANPGMLEMMRLRDRKPPYEDPVPWAGEFVGKYLTSCVLARRLTDDPGLQAVTERTIAALIATQSDDGYLGPFPDKRLLDRWDLWGHYHCMLALVLWHRDTGSPQALEAATRAADLMCATFLDTGRRVHEAGSHEMNMAVMHVLGMLYRETRKETYLRLLREIETDWRQPPAGDYHRLAASRVEFFRTPKPRWESLHPMAALAELHRITGDDSYRDALAHWWWSIRRTDIHNSGSFSTNEQAVGNPFRPGAIETCCTVAWMLLSVETLRLTEDSRIADALESATWNAVLGYQHPSGRWCTYDTPMDGKRLASAHSIVFQSRPGTPELNCCSVNGPNGLGLLSEWAVLGDEHGLYVNYYGPGRTDVRLGDGSICSLIQTTDYPREGAIELEVRPAASRRFPLFVRVPEWSTASRVAVNGEDIKPVRPGTYARIERTWQPGDRVSIELDMRPRALRGDGHVQFRTSLYRGPLLLACDQKLNTIDPQAMPELDFATLRLDRLPEAPGDASPDAFKPIVAVTARAVDGLDIVLCDFATAGAHGTEYRSWLPVKNGPPVPFTLEQPEPDANLPLEETLLTWGSAEPDSTYDVRIATDAGFEHVVAHWTDVRGNALAWQPPAGTRATYSWNVEARRGMNRSAAIDGPRAFTVDPSIESNTKGIVVRAALEGTAEPDEGRLLAHRDIAPAGADSTRTLTFNGATSHLTYAAPRFPLRTFTFSAWIRPRDPKPDGGKWHQIVSAWSAPSNDPLRVAVRDGELVVGIEQPGGGCGISAGRVADGTWVHVALVKRFTELTLYVDGHEKGTSRAAPSFVPGPVNIGIGCNPNHTGPEVFDGEIARVLLAREAYDEEAIARLAGDRPFPP
ncbi:MAG: hypothetical protein FJ297_04710 [Planctomycetes bacterium]|nr:hypothetical protein [Planctomycetota bacterium]